MAPAHAGFANHPGAKEAPSSTFAYESEEEHNPILRGWPLVIASTLLGNRAWLQKIFWKNANFGRAAELPELDQTVPYRFTPNVIPLADGDVVQPPVPGIEAHLTQPQPADLAGRFYSVADYCALYALRQLTPLQVVDALIPLIHRDVKSPSPYSVAWTQLQVDEVREAAKASTIRWASGKQLGVLDGVPIGVKDDMDVKGYVSTKGMRIVATEPFFRTPATATVWPVVKMQEAGAIVMGKMNQHEVGMDTSGCNPATGTPVNWYNESFFPGGSSSGAGSALGAGLVPICLGTDAGGSIRIPSAFNGAYALKTTHNRTSYVNSTMCIIGPMAGTVSDLTIAYRTMSQPDAEDPVTSLFAPSIPPVLTAASKKYLGICEAWTSTASPPVLTAFKAAVNHLTSTHGYEVVDIKLPWLKEAQWVHVGACLTEAVDHAKACVKDPAQYLSLLNHANRIQVGVGSVTPAGDFMKYAQMRQVIMAHVAWLFEQYPGMLIITPTTPDAGWPVNPGDQAFGFTDGNRAMRNMRYIWLANMTGCPATTCPVAYVEPTQGEGKLPVGLMATGIWGAEEQLLGFARELEGYLNEVYPGGRQRSRGWVDLLAKAKGDGSEEDTDSK